MTTCTTCNKEVGIDEITEGICDTCRLEEIKDDTYLSLWDYRNLYTYSGKSNGINLIVYGLIVPMALVGLGFFIGEGYAVLLGILLALFVGFAAVVRRGRDAGNTPTHTISTLIITSFFMHAIMGNTPLGLMIIGYSGNLILGTILLVLIENFYFVYLVFAKKSEMRIYKTSKFVKAVLILLLGLFVFGLIASVMKG